MEETKTNAAAGTAEETQQYLSNEETALYASKIFTRLLVLTKLGLISYYSFDFSHYGSGAYIDIQYRETGSYTNHKVYDPNGKCTREQIECMLQELKAIGDKYIAEARKMLDDYKTESSRIDENISVLE